MAEIKRTYNIPLRSAWLKAPKYRRAKRAVTAVKDFIIKHMKSDNVKIGRRLNMEIWQDGIKSPPSKVTVDVIKLDDGLVKVEKSGFVYEEPIKSVKEEDKSMLEQAKDALTGGKKEDKPKDGKKSDKQESEKKSDVKKDELKDEKKSDVKKDDLKDEKKAQDKSKSDENKQVMKASLKEVEKATKKDVVVPASKDAVVVEKKEVVAK